MVCFNRANDIENSFKLLSFTLKYIGNCNYLNIESQF